MAPELTESDEARFAALREKLDGVSRADDERDEDESTMTTFEPLNPMLAETFDGDLTTVDEADWVAERKYDGTRIILEKFDGTVKLFTRRHVERSETLPEIAAAGRDTLPDGVVLDGEVTFVDPSGRSVFMPIHGGEDKIEEYDLTAIYYVFDVLVEDASWRLREGLLDRRDRVQRLVPDGAHLTPVECVREEFQGYFDSLVEDGEEGIIIKRRDSPYHLNTRSRHWLKVKAFTERDVLAVGYTPGEGQRAATFGALVMTDGDAYLGRVGTGFSERERRELLDLFDEVDDRPFSQSTVGMPYTPIDPVVVSVKYQAVTDNLELRAPVYLRVKPGAPPETVDPIEHDATP